MRLRERQEQSPPDDTPLTPSKEGRGAEVYEQQPEDSIRKQQELRRRADEEVRRQQQQQTKRQQQEHARTTVPAPRKEDPIGVSLRRAGSGAEDAEAPLASVDDCAAALRSLPGGDAALPQIADIVAEFHRSYVTVPGYHKHTSRKVSEWTRACKHALHRAWLQAAARGPGSSPFSSSQCSPRPSSSAAASSSSSSPSPAAAAPPDAAAAARPPPFPSRRAGLAVESCIMSGIHGAVFGSVAKWAGPRDAELAAVMRWLQEEQQQQQQQQGGGGGGGGDGALRRVCGVPDRLLPADLGPAASCLSSVLSCRCPLEMMGCLRGANHAILRAVADVSREEERTRREERRLRLLEQQEDEDAEEAWGGGGGGGGGDAEEEEEPMRGRGGEPDELRQVSADELLPLFIASLAAAAPPQAFSALEYLLTFHQEGDLHGHGGYMLAMLEASMRFLLQFHAKGLVNRQRLGAPAASSSSLLPSASAQRIPHHQRTHQMSPHLHHGHPGAPPPSASWPSGAPEPPPGLSVHPVDDGPPTDPRAGSLPSLTLMGGDYSSIDRASKIFFNSIGKRHLGGAPDNGAAAAAAAGGTAALMGLGDLGLAAAAGVSSAAPWDALQSQRHQQQHHGADEEEAEEEAAAAAADAVENHQFPRLRIDLSLPQQLQDDPPLFPLCGGGSSHQHQESGDSNRGSRGPNSPRPPRGALLAPSSAAPAGATRCSSSSSSSSTGEGGAPDGHRQQKNNKHDEQPVAASSAFRPPAIISARADAPENPSAGLGSFLSGLRSKGEAASGTSRMRLL